MERQIPIAEAVSRLVRSRAPLAPDLAELPGDLRLGPGGLGLDSIALVELLLECEQRFGIPRPVGLLEGEPLTIALLVDHVRTATEA
jgi:acyl carrier protein